ncbi:hypothetical protein OG883_44980 [Streptomyces sp. NBC_01142]|uniref:hypothetical protein n=1 Tax=Streptomyces sp. NBC_01142 TaxID=2975865 RepID=UPI0022570D77|nr:hypothetical protein [Streptomyces sp. NBC_01142]MCX4826797.1 hypothetical protein [Streptomyces sp. NBC_01142]
MNPWTKDMLAEGLRNAARRDQSKAAAELLIEHGDWLEALLDEERPQSANHVRRFAQWGMATDEEKFYAHLEWAEMARHLQTAGHTYSDTQVKVFMVAASLREGVPVNLMEITEGLDAEHARMIVEAIAHAAWPITRTVMAELDVQAPVT